MKRCEAHEAMARFGRWARRRREALGMPAPMVAAGAELTPAHLYHVESGRGRLSPSSWARLREVLGARPPFSVPLGPERRKRGRRPATFAGVAAELELARDGLREWDRARMGRWAA